MHSLANLVVCTNLNFLPPKDEEKKIWKNFVFLLRKITFEPDTPGSWKRGKRAKWFVPWKFWPGAAPCSGHFQKLVRNWQRQKGAFRVVQMRKAFFWQNLVQLLWWLYLCTRNWMSSKTALYVKCGSATRLHRYLDKIGQKHQKSPTGSDRKRYFRCGGLSNPDQSTPIRHTQQCSTIVSSIRVALWPALQKI